MKKKLEASVVAGIAPSGNQRLSIEEKPKSIDLKRKRNKRKLMGKNKKTYPKEFETMKEQINSVVRDVIFETILEQDDPESVLEGTLRVYDNLSNQITMGMKYARVFIADGLKLSDKDGLKISLKRANTELNRTVKLAEDLNELLKKIYYSKAKDYEEERRMEAHQDDMSDEEIK